MLIQVTQHPASPYLKALPATDLRAWFEVEPGLAVAHGELALAGEVLPNIFGYHIMQLGNPYAEPLIACSRIQHQVVLANAKPIGGEVLCCSSDALPVQASTVDVYVLPHVLEFAHSPHNVLREAERVLIPEGYLAIFGFNPWSFFGLWRIAAAWRGYMPWRGRFVGMARLRDWLALLGFDIERVEKLSFRPPFTGTRLHERLRFVEDLGRHFWPFFGNVYFVLARKRVLSVRPIRAVRARQRRLRAAGLAEPTTREGWPGK